MAKRPHTPSADSKRTDLASREELNSFFDGLKKLKRGAETEGKKTELGIVREHLRRFDRQTLERLLNRAFADALKSPGQKLGTAKPPPKSHAGKKKSPGKSKTKRSKRR